MEGVKMNDNRVDCRYECNYFKMLDPGNFLQIKPYQVEVENSRMEDMKSVMRSINEVRNEFETLKSEVCSIRDIQHTDYLRKNMFDMGQKIGRLKEAIKEELLTLIRNEASLSKDVQFMERRIEEWSRPVDIRIFKPFKQSNYKVRKANAGNPVVQFQKFLSQHGGHYGGWEEQDHLLFLKERAKHRKKEKFISTLHCLLPDLSHEMIEEHERWYETYESLKDLQKEAIQKWRTEKETLVQKRKEKENKEVGEEKKQIKKKVHQRINIVERIKEWKIQQRLRKFEDEERQKKEKEKLKQEEKKKLEMQEMKRLAVAQYKAEKLNKLKEMFPKSEKRLQAQEGKAKNKILLKAFRLQDLKFVEKKKVLRLHVESKSSNELRLAKPALEFILQRNPERVFQPTLIWSRHCLETQKREKINPFFDLNSIPRLAIPEWRRALK